MNDWNKPGELADFISVYKPGASTGSMSRS